MDKKVILTVQGVENIKAELDQLVKIGLPDAEKKIELAYQNNGDVQDATAYRDFCRDRIANLGEMLCEAKVLPDKKAGAPWISVNDQLPETCQRVIARFETTYQDKRVPHVTIADYIAPRTVLEADYMNEDFAGEGDYDEEKDCYWTVSGWYESSYEADVNWRLSHEVTHWMPQPSADLSLKYRVLIEGAERILDDYADVIDHIQTNVHFEVDEQDMENWLPKMYISEKVFLRDDCMIERIK